MVRYDFGVLLSNTPFSFLDVTHLKTSVDIFRGLWYTKVTVKGKLHEKKGSSHDEENDFSGSGSGSVSEHGKHRFCKDQV